MKNQIVPLITNLARKNKEYIVFVGAGFSKDAGIMSGWDILIETLKPIYLSENNISKIPKDWYPKIEKWFLSDTKYENLGYSDILATMYKGEIERREYLKQFFQNKIPGESHKQLALMVANNLVRFIFTTNIDDLIERALDDLGIYDYDVISSDQQLEQTVSWDKVRTCRIYKLHGDYKSGVIRNTYKETKKLSPMISSDFQYILDRHGLIVIGYAGRDTGIMDHFKKRPLYSYPFYWQYRNNQPPKSNDFKSYYELINIYNNEIIFVKNESASKFIITINEGIEKLEKLLIIEDDDPKRFENFIINNNYLKLRGFTLSLFEKYTNLYKEYRDKEAMDRTYLYRYDIFVEFIKKIEFVINYLNALLTFDKFDEATSFTKRIIRSSVDENWKDGQEFLISTTPYYLIMNIGALYLKYDKPELINSFYNFQYKINNTQFYPLLGELSYYSDGWNIVAREKYSINYRFPKYSIIQDELLPIIISKDEFNLFDAYITIDIIIKKFKFGWIPGSCMDWRKSYLTEAYLKYLKSRFTLKEAKILTETLEKKYEHFKYDEKEVLTQFVSLINEEFSLDKNNE